MYAEIILPLPIYSTFTYSVPEQMESNIQSGCRVLVQFGRKKFYTGIVSHVHNDAPEYDVKEITELLDDTPILKYPQLNLWRWISEYYLCSEGDVMKAALPAGLKPESETFVTLTDISDGLLEFDGIKLTERQALVVALLQEKGRMKIADIESELRLKNTPGLVNSMLQLGVLRIDERVIEKYRPRKDTFVKLTLDRNDQDGLHDFFGMVTRSRKQEQLLIAWLDMSGWLHPTNPLKDVQKQSLIEAAGVTPGILKAMVDKGIFKLEKRVINRFNSPEAIHSPNLSALSEQQKRACNAIKEGFLERKPVLLHGITGSGKTEIYTHLMAAAMADGNQVLYLVPEISLTTQLTDRLHKVFGDRLLVYHSKFSDNERVDIWNKILKSREPVIILGVRSSIFLPFSRLGLVIIDEEHESSYKQYDPAPRYNARDTAMVLASMHGAHLLLGSATPAIDTYYKAKSGKYSLVELTERYEGSILPEVNIVDMRRMRKEKQVRGFLSTPLRKGIKETLDSHRQVIMFQNRRGFAPMVICRQCGWTPKCPNCDVSLVYHKQADMLRCHYCGHLQILPKLCPACGENTVDTFGYGTERIAEELHESFPDFRVARMDLDTTRNKDAYQEIIEDFSAQTTDILVGTQMISKGLDFDKVNLVGVANADTLLNFPDFRSNERAFNMLEQVAGRSGRRKEPGKVIIQTSRPEETVLTHVKAHDYQGYYQSEIEERKKYSYPPFTKIINIYLKNKDSAILDRLSVTYALELRKIFGARVLGPERPFVSKVALWHIQCIMLKIESNASMKKVKEILRKIYENMVAYPEMKSTVLYYDVDPA